jgi:hypothetical protein
VPGHVAFQDQPAYLLRKRANRLRPRKVVERGSVP